MLCYLINSTAHTRFRLFVFFCFVAAMGRFGKALNVHSDPQPERLSIQGDSSPDSTAHLVVAIRIAAHCPECLKNVRWGTYC